MIGCEIFEIQLTKERGHQEYLRQHNSTYKLSVTLRIEGFPAKRAYIEFWRFSFFAGSS